MAQVCGFKSQDERQSLALGRLRRRRRCRSGVFRCGRGLGLRSGGDGRRCGFVGGFAHHYTLLDEHRCLEAVFIGHVGQIVFNACDGTPACGVEVSYSISYVEHVVSLMLSLIVAALAPTCLLERGSLVFSGIVAGVPECGAAQIVGQKLLSDEVARIVV